MVSFASLLTVAAVCRVASSDATCSLCSSSLIVRSASTRAALAFRCKLLVQCGYLLLEIPVGAVPDFDGPALRTMATLPPDSEVCDVVVLLTAKAIGSLLCEIEGKFVVILFV